MRSSRTRRASALCVGLSLALLVGLSSSSAGAASWPATPATLSSVLARARGGDTIVLKGDFNAVRVADRQFDPPLTFDARGARLTGWKFSQVSGVRISGGVAAPPTGIEKRRGIQVYGPALDFRHSKRIKLEGVRFQGPEKAPSVGGENPADGYGAIFADSSAVEVVDSEFRSFKVGIVLGRTDGFKVEGNTFRLMRADGIDVANSWNGLIAGNDFRDTRKRDKEHPDAIQMWSRPTAKPTSDLVIRGNKIRGMTQGISGFNHVRNGVNDGGFDRLTITDNDIEIQYSNAIAVVSGRDVQVMNNRIRTLDGALSRASINLGRSPGAVRRGNIVEAGSGKPGDSDRDAPSSTGSKGGDR